MQTAYQFFLKNAGYSFDPAKETREQGKRRCAREMAKAESTAVERGWYIEWREDFDGCAGCECGSNECPCFRSKGNRTSYHEPQGCVVYDEPRGNVLASLWGICGADSNYRRVIQAELALEALAEAGEAA